MWFRKPKSDPADVSRSLRDQALSVKADAIGATPTARRQHVWAVLMETGYPDAVASLVAFADGTTSMYFSSGGGVIGAGDHEHVRVASQVFLDQAEAHVVKFSPTTEHPLPAPGRVRFYVRTFGGLLTAEADEDDLGYERHELSPVFHSGHTVISEIREIEESKA